MLFARLGDSTVPDDLDLRNSKILKNLDERCVRSLNGSRVTDDILRLVPDVDAFRTALRCIKVWAKSRAIYSNVMGFFGGVAWAIVVARVCQMFPNATSSTIVHKFFKIMKDWSLLFIRNWPEPVMLQPIEDGPLSVRVWNPKIYPQDRAHRMPVITPAYPSMCSTHNVTHSTQLVQLEEFDRASVIVDNIMQGKDTWNSLFQKDDFFHKYKHYLQVVASSDNAEDHIKWAGLVESKLRQLIMKLELVENLDVAHPYIKGFDRVIECKTEKERLNAHHGIFKPKPASPIAKDLPIEVDDSEVFEEPKTIWTTTFYVGLRVTKKDPLNPNASRKLDVVYPKSEFQKLVQSGEQFDLERMGIDINYIKR